MKSLKERLDEKTRKEAINELMYQALLIDEEYAGKVFKFLSDHERSYERQTFFLKLIEKPHTTTELEVILEIPEATAYNWMKVLREFEIVQKAGKKRLSQTGGPNATLYTIPGVSVT